MSEGPAGRESCADPPRSADAQGKSGNRGQKKGDILSPWASLQNPLGLEGCDPLDALMHNAKNDTQASAQIVSAYRQLAIFFYLLLPREIGQKKRPRFCRGRQLIRQGLESIMVGLLR